MKRLFSTVLLLTLAAIPSTVFGMEPIESRKKSTKVGGLRALFEKPNEPRPIAPQPKIAASTATKTRANSNTTMLAPRGSKHLNITRSPEPNENVNSGIQNNNNISTPPPATPTPEPEPEIAVNNIPHQHHEEISDVKPSPQDSDIANPASPIEDLHDSIKRRRSPDDDNFSDNDDYLDDITSSDAKAQSEKETKNKTTALSQQTGSSNALIQIADTIAKKPISSPKLPTEVRRLQSSGIKHSDSNIDLTDVTHAEWGDGVPDPAAQGPIKQDPRAQAPAPATIKESIREETAPEYDAWQGKNILIATGLYFLMHTLQNTEYATKIKAQYPKSSEALFTLGQQALAANAVQQLLPGKPANSLAFIATFTALHAGEMLLKKAVSALAKKAPFKKIALAFKKLSPNKQDHLEKLSNFAGWAIKTLIARKLTT